MPTARNAPDFDTLYFGTGVARYYVQQGSSNTPFRERAIQWDCVAVIALIDAEHADNGAAPLEADVEQALAAEIAEDGESVVHKGGQQTAEQRKRREKVQENPAVNQPDIRKFTDDRDFKKTCQPAYEHPGAEPLRLATTHGLFRRQPPVKVNVVQLDAEAFKRDAEEGLDRVHGARHNFVDGAQGQQLVVRLIFDAEQTYNPMVILKITLTWCDIAGTTVMLPVYLYLTRQTLRNAEAPFTYEVVASSPESIAEVATSYGISPEDAEAKINKGLTAFRFSVRGDPLHASNLFNRAVMYGPHAATIERLRQFVTRNWELTVFTEYVFEKETVDACYAAMLAASQVVTKPYQNLLMKRDCDKVVIQKGQMPTIQELPRVAHPSVVVYGNTYQFLATEMYGALIEVAGMEQEDAIRKNMQDIPIRMIWLAESHRGAAHVFIDVPSCPNPDAWQGVKPGTKVDMEIPALDPEHRLSSRWTGYIIDHVPGIAPTTTQAFIKAPQDSEGVYIRPGRPTMSIPNEYPLIGQSSTLREGIQALTVLQANITTTVYTKKEMQDIYRVFHNAYELFTRERNADEHNRSATSTLLEGTRPDRLPIVDWLEGVDEDLVAQLESSLDPATGQRGIITNLRNVQGGVAIVNGVAGCGKTHSALRIVQAVARQAKRNEHDGKRDARVGQVLVVSALNHIVDTLATEINEQFEEDEGIVAVRLYASDIDKRLAYDAGNQARHAAAKLRDELFAEIDRWQHTTAGAIYDHHKEITNFEVEAARDKRVRRSVAVYAPGLLVFRRAGLGDEPITDRACYQSFATKYEYWKTHPDLDEDWKNSFDLAYYKCLDDVYQTADILVGTPRVALDVRVVCNINPKHIICDESSKAANWELIGLFTLYPECRKYLFLLDHYQLGAVVKTEESDNIFAPQLKSSMVIRMIAAGYHTMTISHQRRYGLNLCETLSKVFCTGYLHTQAGFVDERRGDTALIRAAFSARGNLILLNCATSGEAKVHPSMSRINNDTAKATFGIVRKIVQDTNGQVLPKDMQIITTYLAQESVLKAIKRELEDTPASDGDEHITAADWKKLTVVTVNRAQGTQKYVTVLDITATNSAGHLMEPSRLFTAITRTTGICIIVADFERLAKLRSWNKDFILYKLYKHCEASGNVKELPQECMTVAIDTLSHQTQAAPPRGARPSQGQEQADGDGEGWGTPPAPAAGDNNAGWGTDLILL